jgi:hypothetical protein
MNILDEHKYNEFSNILSGCRTVLDAYHFAEIYIKKNPEMKGLVYSMVNGKRYESIMDFKTVKSVIESLNECQFRDDADEIIELYSKKTFDSIQKRSLSKISKNKPSRPLNYQKHETKLNINTDEKINLVSKMCPHCGHPCTTSVDSTYVICGYIDIRSGYDWKGCGKDWCFKCGKILCKSWDTNQLFLEMNRYHDHECCKNHAKENSRQYPEEYCYCENQNVKRI